MAPAGLHPYRITNGNERTQVHLRVEPDGRGLLLVNANRAFHLNPSATSMAWLHLEGVDPGEALHAITRNFRVDPGTAAEDYRNLCAQLQEMVQPGGACPIHDLEFEVLAPFSEMPSAPFRMDLALTYRCNANCSHCYNARPRSYPELSTDEWVEVIDRLWDVGIPHICFTGGEATLRADLPTLVAHASKRGQITGLLSNGRRLADPDLTHRLVDAGLDHVQITLESHRADIHDRMVAAQGAWEQTVSGIRNALAAELYVMTNTTLLQENAASIGATVDFLAELGVPTVGCNALIYAGRGTEVVNGIPERELEPLLEIVRTRTSAHGQRLIWYTPTMYCHFDPVQFQLGVKSCTAARYNMCVEPDGAVIPCQSFYQPVGNMLRDDWHSIWGHELCLWLRERRYAPEECTDCHFLKECGAGCPLSLLQGQAAVDRLRMESAPQVERSL
jgi:radical SAM protein with 4Fe4S-binding SPASM domain